MHQNAYAVLFCVILATIAGVRGQLLVHVLNSIGDMVKNASLPTNFTSNLTNINNNNNGNTESSGLKADLQNLHNYILRMVPSENVNGGTSSRKISPLTSDTSPDASLVTSNTTSSKAAEKTVTKLVRKYGKERDYLKSVPRLKFTEH